MEIKNISESNYLLFIDISSLKHVKIKDLFAIIVPLLSINKKSLLIPDMCLQLLKEENADCYEEIERIASMVKKVSHPSNLASTFEVFAYIFEKLGEKNNLLLITEDKKLRDYLLKKRNKNGKYIEIVTVDDILNYKEHKKSEPHFRICVTITTLAEKEIIINKVPGVNSVLYTNDDQKIQLGSVIKPGGEGTVYNVDDKFVAKIYFKDKLTTRKKEKVLLIINSGIRIPGVCFPSKALYNEQREFVGYLMPLAKGRSLDGSFFKGEIGVSRYFGNWTRADLVTLALTILYVIKKLHSEGILLGDINGSNILVNKPQEVYFVDTDSYQINEFPCPVGTETFTAPEIQGFRYDTFLRTRENENFAVATLLFKLLMFGMDPYAHQGGESIAKNIKTGDFSFPFQEKSNKKIPDGDWRFFWSHLYFPIKKCFYETFRSGECQYDPDSRPNDGVWFKLLSGYKLRLEKGEQDPESNKMFPKTYKKDPSQTYVVCKLCNTEVNDKYVTKGYCSNCLNKVKTYKCKTCGKLIQFKNYKRLVQGLEPPKYCSECTQEYFRKQKVFTTRTCSACDEEFTITIGEYEFFKKKGLDLPKRCKSCRREGYYGEDDDDYYDDNSYSSGYSGGSYSSSSSSSSGGCYITTAACEYFGKHDDCYELNTLRYFRDEWLVKQPEGMALISEYYKDAPVLVNLIKQAEDYEDICMEIMNVGVNPCIELINKGKFAECQDLYIQMVKHFYEKIVTNKQND